MTALLDDVTIQRTSTGKSLANVESAMLLRQITAHSYAENNQEDQRRDYDLMITGAQGALSFKTGSKDMTRISIPNQFGSVKEIYNTDHYM